MITWDKHIYNADNEKDVLGEKIDLDESVFTFWVD